MSSTTGVTAPRFAPKLLPTPPNSQSLTLSTSDSTAPETPETLKRFGLFANEGTFDLNPGFSFNKDLSVEDLLRAFEEEDFQIKELNCSTGKVTIRMGSQLHDTFAAELASHLKANLTSLQLTSNGTGPWPVWDSKYKSNQMAPDAAFSSNGDAYLVVEVAYSQDTQSVRDKAKLWMENVNAMHCLTIDIDYKTKKSGKAILYSQKLGVPKGTEMRLQTLEFPLQPSSPNRMIIIQLLPGTAFITLNAKFLTDLLAKAKRNHEDVERKGTERNQGNGAEGPPANYKAVQDVDVIQR